MQALTVDLTADRLGATDDSDSRVAAIVTMTFVGVRAAWNTWLASDHRRLSDKLLNDSMAALLSN